MGCIASRVDKEKRVQICKERKRLMKQLVRFREEFADAQLAYLRALKNTGVTLRQFTESESLELENTSAGLAMPPSPALSLPPSPPLPPFSPGIRKSTDNPKEEVAQEVFIKVDADVCYTPSAPPNVSTLRNMWNLFEPSCPQNLEEVEMVEPEVEEEIWAETKTEFEDEDQEEEIVGNVLAKHQAIKLVDHNSSAMNWCPKDTADMAMVVGRSKKTLEDIVKELDDYFLKASALEKEVAVLMDISKGDTSLSQNFKENKRNRSNSARVFSALSWRWSSKLLQLAKEAAEVCAPSEPCKPGAHCVTLDKLYAADKKLYKDMREEEIIKLEHERKSKLLLKQEEENNDETKIDKTRSSVESLEIDIRRLQHAIGTTCSSILEVIDVEIYPQLVTLTSGLKNMWRKMYESHQFQNHISRQLKHLTDNQSTDCTTDFHHQATAQLEAEATYWYLSFCKLIKYQREYVRTLSRWFQLTNCLVDDHQRSGCLSAARRLCDEWQLVFDRLPDKKTAEAIKSFLSAIQSIMQKQAEEKHLLKKSNKLDKRLQKALFSLAEMQEKLELSFAAGEEESSLSPKHPLSLKRSKTEALSKLVDAEKTKYLSSVEVTSAMTLNNLKTTLPYVFESLMEFSSTYAQGFEAVLSHGKTQVDCDV